jgi:SET domain-containing protein
MLHIFSIDATDNERLGRFVNDAQKRSQTCNCTTKLLTVENRPHIVLFASKDISVGQEIRYDYGGGTALPWRKVRQD